MSHLFKNCITIYIWRVTISMHVSFICSNQIFQISSFVLYAKKFVENVSVIGSESKDVYSKYCKKLGVDFYFSNNNEDYYSKISTNNSDEEYIFINIDEITFKKLEHILSLDFNNFKDMEVYFSNHKKNRNIVQNQEKCFKNLKITKNISWIYFNKNGLEKFGSNPSLDNLQSIKFNLDTFEDSVFSKSSKKAEYNGFKLNKPLLFFGVPGILLIVSSFILVSNVVSKYDSIDSVSLGTAIITIGATVIGILSVMSAIISYVLGKQTEFLLTNYSE